MCARRRRSGKDRRRPTDRPVTKCYQTRVEWETAKVLKSGFINRELYSTAGADSAAAAGW